MPDPEPRDVEEEPELDPDDGDEGAPASEGATTSSEVGGTVTVTEVLFVGPSEIETCTFEDVVAGLNNQ